MVSVLAFGGGIDFGAVVFPAVSDGVGCSERLVRIPVCGAFNV